VPWSSIRRFERVVGEPVLGNDMWLTEDTLELVEHMIVIYWD